MIEYLKIGKIVNTMGIKGELKVLPLTDDLDRFLDLEWAFVNRKNQRQKYNIQNVWFHKNFVIIRLQDINDMTTAETFKESFLEVDREHAVQLEENEFFVCDLIGIDIYTEEGDSLGKLIEVLPTGSNDVYLVKDTEGKEIMLPAIKDVIKEVDVKNKRMVVKLMEGLVE